MCAGKTLFIANQELGVVDLMPGEPLDLRTQAFSRCNLSAGHVVRRRRVALTSSVARVSTLPSLAKIGGSFFPVFDRNRRYITSIDLGDSITSSPPAILTELLYTSYNAL